MARNHPGQNGTGRHNRLRFQCLYSYRIAVDRAVYKNSAAQNNFDDVFCRRISCRHSGIGRTDFQRDLSRAAQILLCTGHRRGSQSLSDSITPLSNQKVQQLYVWIDRFHFDGRRCGSRIWLSKRLIHPCKSQLESSYTVATYCRLCQQPVSSGRSRYLDSSGGLHHRFVPDIEHQKSEHRSSCGGARGCLGHLRPLCRHPFSAPAPVYLF